MFFLAVGCALALVTHPLEGQTSRTFLATSLTKPLQAPRFDGHEHAALLQDTVRLRPPVTQVFLRYPF